MVQLSKYSLLIFSLWSFIWVQDIAGNYKLTGLYIIYYNIARYDTPIVLSDTHDFGMQITAGTIYQGEIYRHEYQGPFPEFILNSSGVILNVNFYLDGSGEIVEGSYYPSIQIVDCQPIETVLPLTDQLAYTSNLNAGITVPSSNILGIAPDSLHTPLPNAEAISGSFSLSQSVVFDYFPSIPTSVSIPFPVIFGDFNGNGTIEYDGIEGIAPDSLLPGLAGGYVLKNEMSSFIPGNVNADLYLEWHAIDGELSQSGLGNEVGVDEDGDGTIFDRIFGMDYITITTLNPGCGYNYPAAGNQVDLMESIGQGFCLDCQGDDCLDFGTFMYLMDSSLANWGYFLTYNASQYSLTQNPDFLTDDSDHDFNGTDGRLIMNFSPTCVQDINVRHIMVEFQEIGGMEIVNTFIKTVDFEIQSLYPNPFNPVISGSVFLAEPGNLTISVFDASGQFIETIIENEFAGGKKSFSWNGSLHPSGIYFIRAEAGHQLISKKVILLK